MVPMVHTAARFAVAFPWFEHSRWAWLFDADATSGPAYTIRPQRRGARGTLEIYMHGASAEQCREVTAWLIAALNPAFEVPATRFVDIGAMGQRAGGHNSTMPT